MGSRTSGTARNRIGEIRVEDCVVFNGGFPQHFVYSAASTSQTAVGKIRLCDSTFADMARGAVVTNARMQTRVEIERCTFYDINRADNNAGTIRLGNAEADIRVTESVFTFAGPASRFIVAGPGSKVAVEDSYATGELASIPGARGLKTASRQKPPKPTRLRVATRLRKASRCASGKTVRPVGRSETRDGTNK